MAMTRSARKNTKSEPSASTGLKRNRDDYLSDLPAENPRVAGNNQPISKAHEASVEKVDRSVTTDNDEDGPDEIPTFMYDPPWQKDLVRNEEFYFSLVTLQVENCLFRLPRQSLEANSEVCERIFTALEKEGKDLSLKTVALRGITACNFCIFLRFLFPSSKQTGFSANEWLVILYTARFLESTAILKRAMRHLETDPIMTGFTRLDVAQLTHNIRWYKKSLFELAIREKPLNLLESENLGMEMVVKVNDARNKWHDISIKGLAIKSTSIKEKEMLDYIEKLFKPEIDDLREP